MKSLFTMRQALTDPLLLADALKGSSWDAWRTLLIAAVGEELTEDERAVFKSFTGRDHGDDWRSDVIDQLAEYRSGRRLRHSPPPLRHATRRSWSARPTATRSIRSWIRRVSTANMRSTPRAPKPNGAVSSALRSVRIYRVSWSKPR